MKALLLKLEQNKQKLGTIYQYNQHILNSGDSQQIQQLQQGIDNSKLHKKKQSYAEKQQNISILQIQKPIIEFDIQISREISDKMVIFIDSVPEEIVEEFIIYNKMHPQSFSPILMLVLEKMKDVENQKDMYFNHLREDKYYQILMKKQQQLCQELQNIKEIIQSEKKRGQDLLQMKLSRINDQNLSDKKGNNSFLSPNQKGLEEYYQDPSSFKNSTRSMTQRSPYQEVSSFPHSAQQQNQDINDSIHNEQNYINKNLDQDEELENQYENQANELSEEKLPLKIYYDHLSNPQPIHSHNIYNQNQFEKQRNATPKSQKVIENTKKAKKSNPSLSPPLSKQQVRQKPISQLKFVKNPKERSNSPMNPVSPLKYPNEESYREKNERKKQFYNHAGELIDPIEVSERLHKQKKEPPCPKYEPKKDVSEKEYTFKPQINENSRSLAKIYHQKQNAKNQKIHPGQENEQDLYQRLRSKSKGKTNRQNNNGDGDENSKSEDATIYTVVNSSQLKSSTASLGRKANQNIPFEETIYANTMTPNQNQQNYHEYERQANPSPRNNYNQNPLTPYNYVPQKAAAPVYEKQINIREEIIYQHPSNNDQRYQPQRVSNLKQLQEHSVQTSEFINVSNDVPQNTTPVPFDPNLNQNYFKYLQMREDIEQEGAQMQENPPILQSFSNQPQEQPAAPIKKSFGMQTSEQIQQSKFNKSTSIKTSDIQSERAPVEFDPNLNKNYFKFLQMQEEVEKERGLLPHFASQNQSVVQSKVVPNLSQQLSPKSAQIEKKNISLQTSDYLMYLKSQSQSNQDGNDKENKLYGEYSHEETPKQFVPFDPNLNQNYFKFLQMEEEKQRDDDILKQQFIPNSQKKSAQSIDDRLSSLQSVDHINTKKYEEETPKQTIPFDPHLNQNYFKYLAMQDQNSLNQSANSQKPDQQFQSNPQTKQFPENRNSPLRRSQKSYHQPPSPTNQHKNSSMKSSVSNQDQNKNYKLNGSIFYVDEEPAALQTDDPFMTNSQKQQQNTNNIQQQDSGLNDFRFNLHKSNFVKPQDMQIAQKPDITISSIRSVSPRIEKTSQNVQHSVSPRNEIPQRKQVQDNKVNLPQFHSNGLQLSQSQSQLFQSKMRGQITEQEQESLESVYNILKTCQRGSQLIKADIDLNNLPFEVVLKSHIEIILKNFDNSEVITLQGFFQASEKSNNLNLFLNECQDFLNKRKKN
ncbi:hypothetical protein ABPG74_012838 [Tetrahymena malaccensis]